MEHIMQHTADPRFDLVLERELGVAPELVWRAWTECELLKQWFCPLPWKTTECEIELFPGGKFRTKMEGPDGDSFDGTGCFLEVVPNEKLVWTSALGPDFRPQANPLFEGGFFFTAIVTMASSANGTSYRVIARHGSEEARKQHEDMGFESGWGQALNQLVELVKSMPR